MEINKTYMCHPTNFRAGRRDDIKYIVIHYVGATGNAKNNVMYYANTPYVLSSAHYFVGHASEGGAIYQSVSDEDCAWHCGAEMGNYYSPCRNDSAIGIEMCCHFAGDSWYFDDVTVQKTIELVRKLMKKYSIPIENVIRHYDVTHKRCPAPYVADEALWNNFKEELVKMADIKELESINDIVWELGERGIIADKELWIKKLEEDSNVYWLARKAVNYIRKMG